MALHLVNVHLIPALDRGETHGSDLDTKSNTNLLFTMPEKRKARVIAIMTAQGYHFQQVGRSAKVRGTKDPVFKASGYWIGLTPFQFPSVILLSC